jgi:hypothetical protein
MSANLIPHFVWVRKQKSEIRSQKSTCSGSGMVDTLAEQTDHGLLTTDHSFVPAAWQAYAVLPPLLRLRA